MKENETEKYTCNCGKTFKNKGGYKTHSKFCEEGDLENPTYSYFCDNCDKKFSREENYERHVSADNCYIKKKLEDSNQSCEYGCGQEANWKLKNGKYCCSEYDSSCPAIRKKNSEGLKKAYERGDKDTEHLDGYRAWCKGKTYEEVLGKEKAKKYKEKISEAAVRRFEEMSDKELNEFSNSVSKGLKESDGNIGGIREGTNKWRGCWYYNKNEGEEVWLDSSWEKKFVKWLDEKNVKWKRNTEKFDYTYKNKNRKYIPDFFLPDNEIYIEVKGYKKEKDEAKWRDFPYKLELFQRDRLKENNII